MYPAGPGSGDSPEGFPEQPRLQPQIGNHTAQTLGTELGSITHSLLPSVAGVDRGGGMGKGDSQRFSGSTESTEDLAFI